MFFPFSRHYNRVQHSLTITETENIDTRKGLYFNTNLYFLEQYDKITILLLKEMKKFKEKIRLLEEKILDKQT
jgi:hypothetical protein